MSKFTVYFLTFFLFLAAVAISAPRAFAATGNLDTTFGTGGQVITSVGSGGEDGDQGSRMVLDSSGRIVVVGWTAGTGVGEDWDDFAVVRYNSDGTLDETFGIGGKVKIDFGGLDDVGLAVAIDSGGNIIAAGVVCSPACVFALARLTSSGVLDSSFGDGGKVITAFNAGSHNVSAVTIQSDGKIIVVGDTVAYGIYRHFALARYNTNGSLDTTFDSDGKVTTDFNVGPTTAGAYANAVALDASNRIVVAGGAASNFALARYNTNGSLDTTFDTDGILTTDFGAGSVGSSLAIDASGKIVVAGTFASGSSYNFALARYNTNGSLDTTFDTDGKVTTDVNSGGSFSSNVVVYGNLIFTGGFATSATGADFAVVVYNNNGSLNTSYGSGKFIYDFFGTDEVAMDMKVQPDSQVLLLGTKFAVGGSQPSDIILERVNGPVAEGFKSTVAAGGMLTTDDEGDGATSTDPLETSVTTPTGGTVSIYESQTASIPVSGYGVLNQKVVISAPVETAASPLRMSFKIDSSIIPGGINKNNIDFYRNGTKVKNCLGSTVATPDPCITARTNPVGDAADIQVDILTSQASTWGMSGPAIGSVRAKGIFDLANSAFAGTVPVGFAAFDVHASYKGNEELSGKFKLVLQNGSNFESSSIDWLWTGGNTGVVSGSGTLNGIAGYGFQIMADANSNSIRVIITKAEVLIFDNLFGTNIEFGAGNLEPILGSISVK